MADHPREGRRRRCRFLGDVQVQAVGPPPAQVEAVRPRRPGRSNPSQVNQVGPPGMGEGGGRGMAWERVKGRRSGGGGGGNIRRGAGGEVGEGG